MDGVAHDHAAAGFAAAAALIAKAAAGDFPSLLALVDEVAAGDATRETLASLATLAGGLAHNAADRGFQPVDVVLDHVAGAAVDAITAADAATHPEGS